MSPAIDLNADAGEGSPADDDLVGIVTSLNIACGVHAGSPETIARLTELARARGVGAGAHPGLAAGRAAVAVTPAAAAAAVRSQVAAFRRASLAPLAHVKLHGALYHAARDAAVARAVVEAALDARAPILVAQCDSPLAQAARAAGLRVAEEAFLDRAYGPDGLLVARDREGALIVDPAAAAARAVRIALEGSLLAADGTEIRLRADTLCVHSDTPGAALLAAAARRALERASVRLLPMGTG